MNTKRKRVLGGNIMEDYEDIFYEPSYREMLFNLAQKINCDSKISKEDRREINKAANKLFDLLWKY
jgi:hypothetical protein